MKVVVIGGAGVFGSRLAEMLARDGHDVVLAGRHPPDQLAARIGASAVALDRTKDLSPLWALSPDVVLDAAGPFHAYGEDPYRLPRSCIERGVHYLDLADDTGFCAGIVALDDLAKTAGVVALSGASSVPALSSAIAADLAADADEIDMITTAILPGNKAPRGRSVVTSILHQTGTTFTQTTDYSVSQMRSWSAPATFDLGDGKPRRAYQISVPDQTLFPAHFSAGTVRFYAGLELGIMGRGLALWSWVRGKLGLRTPAWFTRLVHLAAELLRGFGTDTGGMIVEVVQRKGDNWVSRRWALVVRDGQGPCIPGVAARAILRDIDDQRPGAGPALARFGRDQAEAAMSDLAAECNVTQAPVTPLFQRVLGPAFDQLDPAVRDSHATIGPRLWRGTGTVTRGGGLWPRLIAVLNGFPKATDHIEVTVLKTPHEGGEIWKRQFGDQVFHSVLTQGPDEMTERFGPLTFDLGLGVQDGSLHFPVIGGRIGRIPIPRVLLPKSVAREHASGGKFCYDVALYAPLTGQMIVHYRGSLARQTETEA